ncbi:MAG: tRNA-guanine transglycosylase [Armatimonadetes bacterium]|nr:tRNA-guanine transglycosylase [Armatimonadota bacterium]MDE2207195.1 tRNA-guanine transglycosylase [Armatimonadota bacterium]
MHLPHGAVPLPAFLPDATHGYVRSADAADLETAGVQAVVMNAFHLARKPGAGVVSALGGAHAMAGWNRPIVMDSGGFQIYSLIRAGNGAGVITPSGFRYRSEGDVGSHVWSAEKSIRTQIAMGADVAICLDDCTHSDDRYDEQRSSVARTVAWARKCRATFDEANSRPPDTGRMLFAVVQGGAHLTLRRECADRLLEIGFDGYGYGGWPLSATGSILEETLAFVREAVPACWPLHALGIGNPNHVVLCARLGYDLFDSALPTRDARDGRLFTWREDPNSSALATDGCWWRYLYIDDDRHVRDRRPASPWCDCTTCSRYSVGYLRHLRRQGDGLYARLATLHNLSFMQRLMGLLARERAR